MFSVTIWVVSMEDLSSLNGAYHAFILQSRKTRHVASYSLNGLYAGASYFGVAFTGMGSSMRKYRVSS